MFFPQQEIFRICRISEYERHTTVLRNNRQDFYKIIFLRSGNCTIHTAHHTIPIIRPAVLVYHSVFPFEYELDKDVDGFVCIFSTALLRHPDDHISPIVEQVFNKEKLPVYYPDDIDVTFVSYIFKYLERGSEDGIARDIDFLRSYIFVLLHAIPKFHAPVELRPVAHRDARLTALFEHLLFNQFNIDLPSQSVQMIRPEQYAHQLQIAESELYNAVMAHTKKSSLDLIVQYMFATSRRLLEANSWTIAEISRALQFKNTEEFESFFRLLTSLTPEEYRQKIIQSN